MSSTISGIISTDYEGVSRAFTEITPLPSKGYCELFKAKRYGRWFLLKCLKQQYIDDPIYQQLLRKELEILERAFQTTPKLEHITLPQHLQSIGFWSFADSGLHSLYLPADVKELAIHAFSGCKQLTTVTVSPDNPVFDSRDNCNAIIHTATNIMVSGGIAATVAPTVTDFSDDALSGTDRSDFVLPAHIHHIGLWTFIFKVDRVYCQSPVPPAFDSQNGTNVIFTEHEKHPDPIIYVPYGSLDAYRHAEGWSYYAATIVEYPAPPAPPYIIPLTSIIPERYEWKASK